MAGDDKDAKISARVTTVTRRHVNVITPEGEELRGTFASKELSLAPGDLVRFERHGKQIFVPEMQPRRNQLQRSYREKTKLLAANLDRLFIVTAPAPPFNSVFVDRVLVAANHEHIPTVLILNKAELVTTELDPILAIYEALGLPVIRMSAKRGEADELRGEYLHDEELEVAAFVGLSGVGKSTILNLLVPGADQRTGEISERTGQGTQTTTQAHAFLYDRSAAKLPPALLVDLPGLQSFGVSGLTRLELCAAFPDIWALARECDFSDCAHAKEQKCAVRDAVESGRLAPSRYANYLLLLDEIDSAKSY